MGLGECRLGAGSSDRHLFWLVAHRGTRLPLRADGVGEAGDACGGECAQEFVEWPGWVEVGGLLLERGSDGLRAEVVEVEQEVVGVRRFDAEWLAGVGREVVEVEGDDQLGVGGDGGGEDVPVFGMVGHRRLEALDLGRLDFSFLEGCAHRLLDPAGLLGSDPVLDEVAPHLLEDAGAPERCEEFELGEPKQGVAEREG
jgi:hypothetical protein